MTATVYLIGLGPGSWQNMTPRSISTLSNVSVIIGHKTSLDLIACLESSDGRANFINGKEIIVQDLSPLQRADIAIAKVLAGKNVAIVTAGDPGIYAIASTFFNYLKKKQIKIPVEVVPGVPAANVAAALLGAPLGRDFATLSLSDRATPWEGIKRRLKAAASADFVVVLYNPKSQSGNYRLNKAVDILKNYNKAGTPVGVVTNATGHGENIQITTLGEVLNYPIEEQTILIFGNSETYVFDGRMVTPRQYRKGVGY